jgi:hypothetical protein
MGIELKKQNRKVIHIDNPLMHMGFDSNSVFIAKTETSLHSLKRIEKDMLQYTPLGRMVIKLRRMYLASVACVMFKFAKSSLRSNLLGDNPNLTLFSLYKLGYYLSL